MAKVSKALPTARFLVVKTSRQKKFKFWPLIFGFGGAVTKVSARLPAAGFLAATGLRCRIDDLDADFEDLKAKFQILDSCFWIW